MNLNPNGRKIWMFSIFLFVAMGGVLAQLRGSFLPEIKETFRLSESLLGLVAPAATVSILVFVMGIGMRAGKIDIKKFLLIGIALTGLCTFLVGTSFSFPILLVFILGRGFGTGIFRALDRPVMSHLFPEDRGWTYNMHTLSLAVGATSGPLLAILFLELGGWRIGYLVLSVMFIPIFILFWRIELPKSTIEEEILDRESFQNILKDKAVIGMILVLLLNGGIEGGFFTWLPYFSNQFFSRSISNVALSGYLAMYIPGRYVYSRLSKKISYLKIILINALTLTILIFMAFYVLKGFWMLPFIFACGFPVSGIFPTMLAMGTDIFPQHSGPMNAIGMGSSLMGISIFPWIMGIIADSYTTTVAMQSMLFLGIGIIIADLIAKKFGSG